VSRKNDKLTEKGKDKGKVRKENRRRKGREGKRKKINF
jgi:hypothetical protein